MNLKEHVRQYINKHGTTSKILYRKGTNVFMTAYNFLFHRYGKLMITKHDKNWVFQLYKYNVCMLSVLTTSNIDEIQIMYRNVRISNNSLVDTNLLEMRSARGEKDITLLWNYFNQLLLVEY